MPDNRKPLKYGAFPVCRNYTVRAYIRCPFPAERRRCKDCPGQSGPCHSSLYIGRLRSRIRAHEGRKRCSDAELHRERFQSLKGKLKGKQSCENKEKACNHCGYRLSCWQREKDSNPHKQSQSLSCYPYTISLSAGIIIHHLGILSIGNFHFFKKIFLLTFAGFRYIMNI